MYYDVKEHKRVHSVYFIRIVSASNRKNNKLFHHAVRGTAKNKNITWKNSMGRITKWLERVNTW